MQRSAWPEGGRERARPWGWGRRVPSHADLSEIPEKSEIGAGWCSPGG